MAPRASGWDTPEASLILEKLALYRLLLKQVACPAAPGPGIDKLLSVISHLPFDAFGLILSYQISAMSLSCQRRQGLCKKNALPCCSRLAAVVCLRTKSSLAFNLY